MKNLNLSENLLETLCLKTPGFSFKNLKSLMSIIEFKMSQKLLIDANVVNECLQIVCPSLVSKNTKKVAKTYYKEIGGYESLKTQIQTLITLPLQKPDLFIKRGLTPSKGILLYGPPGCSKTMFAKALATESNLNFLTVKGPEVFNKYVGDSEKKIREIFK